MREIRIEQSFTNREEDSLNRYLYDISKVHLNSTEEEGRLARKIKAGDQHALDKLVRANLRFVISVAKKYQGQGLPLSDLLNEGNIGLLKAAGMFDETKGFKFISYAVWWIRQAIMLGISEQLRIIRVPMNQILAIQKIRKEQELLEQQLEREPTPEELALVTELKESAIIEHLYRKKTTTSLDEKVNSETDLDLTDVLKDPNMQAADEQIVYESMQKDISRLLGVLKKREQKIISELYGLGGSVMTMDEVAEKNDLSRERIRQIRTDSLAKLRQYAPQRLAEYFQN